MDDFIMDRQRRVVILLSSLITPEIKTQISMQ